MNKIKPFIMHFVGGILSFVMLAPVASAQTAVPDFPVINPADITISEALTNIASWLFGLAGALAVLFLIYGGIQYITGGAKAEETAKKVIMNAIIGLVVIALAYVLATAAITVVTTGRF